VDVVTDDVSDTYVSKTLFAISEFANVVMAGAKERMLVAHVRNLGLIVFSACSHAGIVNVCTDVRQLFPDIPIYCAMVGSISEA
jgi:metal-dependent hydrolase (beta-lactamase superfamily II)